MHRKRILLVAATTGYQTRTFAQAAERMGLDLVMATDRCHVLENPWGDHAIPVRFEEPDAAAEVLAELQPRPDGIVAIGDRPTAIAAVTAARLGIRYNSLDAVITCRNKHFSREHLRAAGLPVPEFFRIPLASDPAAAAAAARYPCVLKPLGLSASRGVIRADDSAQFTAAFERIRSLLLSADILRLHDEVDRYIQVERFIQGREFALEGLLRDGKLQVLALFDKPDPLDGPYFEETIYVTADAAPEALVPTTQRAIEAIGLTEGPVHAEMRVSPDGRQVWMLEIAARPIGGLCSKALRFDGAMPLEELILRHALGEDVSSVRRESQASGVMMIPIPKNGIYMAARGVEQAAAVPQIEEVTITAKEGQRLLQLPEGNSYLGFIFARAATAQQVESALRAAHSRLRFEIATELPLSSGKPS